MMFTLEQARGFVAVAEELHFGRAAERLNMTQPPLSRQVQKLEQALGVELLLRNNRGVVLTAAGEAFLRDARRLLASANRAPLSAQRAAAGQAGTVRIGFTAASAFSVLSPLLIDIERTSPDARVELQEMITDEQVKALVDGDLDLGLARPPFDHDVFESRLVWAEPLCVAVPASHGLALLNRAVTTADLLDAQVILHSPTKARYFYDLVVRTVRINHRNVVHSVDQISTMITLVAAGRGIAFVPQSAQLLGIEGVSYLALEDQPPDMVHLHAIWVRSTSANPTLQRLLEEVSLLAIDQNRSNFSAPPPMP